MIRSSIRATILKPYLSSVSMIKPNDLLHSPAIWICRIFMLLFVFFMITGCPKSALRKGIYETAPQKFYARIETTKGNFEIEVQRDHSPKAADRLYQLIKHEYFNGAIFYRVVPGFVAQFGNPDTTAVKKWKHQIIPDEEVKLGNKRGTLSFARGGKDSRDFVLFINLSDNPRLDTLTYNNVTGFPALGHVTRGMNVVDQLYSGYGDNTMNDGNLMADRKRFLETYPQLDLIKKAYIESSNN
jgi:peptidyl-prolyl cis-trans isomerase A (cyclophilin A)